MKDSLFSICIATITIKLEKKTLDLQNHVNKNVIIINRTQELKLVYNMNE